MKRSVSPFPTWFLPSVLRFQQTLQRQGGPFDRLYRTPHGVTLVATPRAHALSGALRFRHEGDTIHLELACTDPSEGRLLATLQALWRKHGARDHHVFLPGT